MSLAEFTALTSPQLTGKLLLRRIRQQKLVAVRATRRVTKRTVRLALAWHRRQYYLTTAYRDLKTAAARNEDITLACLFVSCTLVFAFASTFARVVLQSFLTMSYLNDLTGFSVLPLTLLFLGALATVGAWLAAWISNILSLAIMDGATRRRNKSLRATFRRGIRLASRTTFSWLLFLAVLTGPIVAVGIVSILFIVLATPGGLVPYFWGMAVTACIGTLWLLYALASFSLAPQIALHDSEVPLFDTFSRSRQLVVRRGRPFILALYGAMAVFIAAMYGLAMYLTNFIGTVSDILIYGAFLVAVVATNLMLTVLYRKRRLARTR